MNKEQLQEWLLTNNQPDEWWVAIDGETKTHPVRISDAVMLKEYKRERDVQLMHTTQSQWFPVDTVSPAPGGGVPTKGSICLQCGYTGPLKTHVKGAFILELVLWLCFIIPGLIYSVWRSTSAGRQKVCGGCGSSNTVPLKTPGGKQAYARFHQ